MTLRGSCNGLVCLTNQQNVMICNISTTEIHNARFPPPYTHKPGSGFSYGFGYDSTNEDYKVVRVDGHYRREISCYDNKAEVYSSRKDSWGTPQGNIPSFFQRPHISNKHVVLVNVALYWSAHRRQHEKGRPYFVFAFDLAAEEFGEIELPVETDRPPAMGVLGGRFAVTCECIDKRYDVDFWVMKEYMVQESWTKLVRISAAGLGLFLTPITYSRGRDKILFVSSSDCYFYWYDLGRERLQYVDIRGYCSLSIAAYLESLVSISAYRGCDKTAETKKNDLGM